jgi:hypothetical protein
MAKSFHPPIRFDVVEVKMLGKIIEKLKTVWRA